MMSCVSTYVACLLADLFDFIKPFFIAVFAFALPFLYDVRLALDKRYNTTLVTERLTKTKEYKFFWSMNIISFILILLYILSQKFISQYIISSTICNFIILLDIVLYFMSALSLYKAVSSLGDFQYTSNFINEAIKDKEILKQYKQKIKRISKKYERGKRCNERCYAWAQKILGWNIRLFARMTERANARYQQKTDRFNQDMQNELNATLVSTDRKNRANFSNIAKIWEYAIYNQDSSTFSNAHKACQSIFRFYQNVGEGEKGAPPVIYPKWLYEEVFAIFKKALANSKTIGFDAQLVTILSLYIDWTEHTALSHQSLYYIDQIISEAINNRRNGFISVFFKWAEQYYLDVLQNKDAADWNEREDNTLVRFVNNDTLVFALFIYVLRAKLFALHIYEPILETEYYTGVQTSYGSKHLYRMEIEDVFQLYLTAHYAFTGYSFLFMNIYPSLFLESESLLIQIDEYTAFLLLKQGKEAVSKEINIPMYDIPNELLKKYFDNLRRIITQLKRDTILVGEFRLDNSVADEDLNKLEANLIASKNNAIREEDISAEKEQEFVDRSKSDIESAFASLSPIFGDDQTYYGRQKKFDFGTIDTYIDKRALIDNPDLDAHSCLTAPAHMFIMNLKYQLYKFICAQIKKENQITIDDMSRMEDSINDIVGNNTKDYLFIDCQLPYFYSKKGKLERTRWSYTYDGQEFVYETGAYYLDNLQNCLLIIKRNDVFSREDIDNAGAKRIGDDFFNVIYTLIPNNPENEDTPQIEVDLSLGVNLYFNPNAEIYLVRVG